MLSSVGLEVMNSTNSELSWKTVTKGRRSKKPIARSLNSVSKVGKSVSPKRVGDFSGSDSDKFGNVVVGQLSTSGKSESVPIKKRRHLIQSSVPHSRTPNSRRQDSVSPDSASPRQFSSSPICENHLQLPHPSCSSCQRSANWQLRGIDGSATVRFAEGLGDFSGIELLAAAASMDADDADNVNKVDLVVEEAVKTKNSDALSKLSFESNESEDSSRNNTVYGGNPNCSLVLNNSAADSRSLCVSPKDQTVPKVSRQHWDLNTLMDAWEEPYDDSENASKNVNDEMNIEERQKDSPNLKIKENKSTTLSLDRVCSELPSLKEHLLVTPNSAYSHAAMESYDEAAEKDADERNSNQVLHSDENLNHVVVADDILDGSPFTKIVCSSGVASERNINTVLNSVTVAHDEDCSSNMSECGITTASDRIQIMAQDVIAHDLPSSDISESAIDLQPKDTKVQKTPEPHGTYIQDCQLFPIAGSNIQNDGTSISGSAMADCQGFSGPAELVAKVEDSCKSSRARALCADPISSVGRIGSAIDGQHNSDRAHVVVGDEMARFPEGYDSPYEDGELRGSFLYPWADNEFENEYVDYESDGRNGDSSDAADYPGSVIVEGGSEGSNGNGRFAEGKTKSGSRHTLRRHFVKDDSDNNEIAGKVSNAGSGTTVDQSMEMVEENYDGVKRRQLADRRNFNVKLTQIDEYASKGARPKVQSRTEGLSSTEVTDGNDFFVRQFRSRDHSYSRSERDISPEKYQGRYRSAARGERDEVRQWTSFGSRKHYNSSYQGNDGHNPTRPRSKTGDAVDKIGGLDFHDHPTARQNGNYMSKGLHRPFIKRSPVERDEYFGVGRRMQQPTRGVSSNYRGRGGHYSQRSNRGDYGEDFAPLPDDAAGVYLSRREQSFSPRGGQMTLPRRRSRSRSRTRSPRAWHSNRGRILGTRRNSSRSPDFRVERIRVPFSKPNFASSEYGEGGYMSPSPSRGRFSSPQRNYRWENNNNDRTFPDNHMRRRRSPFRDFRRNERFDGVGPSGRFKRDEHFRPTERSGRFSYNGGGRGGFKPESNYHGRRRDDGGEMMMHRGGPVHNSEEGGANNNVRRSRNKAAEIDGFETKNLDKEDANVGAADLLPQKQGDEKDEKGVLISAD
ncbi:hypothetical protein ABFS82_06G030500 [Erythranthe guttata]